MSERERFAKWDDISVFCSHRTGSISDGWNPMERQAAVDAWNAAKAEAAARESELVAEGERLRNSRDFYKRRCEQLQSIQSGMRDPERQAVCEILANGSTKALAPKPDEKEPTDDE